MNPETSLAKNSATLAMSSGVPMRPIGMKSAANFLIGAPSLMSVWRTAPRGRGGDDRVDGDAPRADLMREDLHKVLGVPPCCRPGGRSPATDGSEAKAVSQIDRSVRVN
jgi:hypothetical protein